MIRIAIVEDDKAASDLIIRYIGMYEKKKEEEFSIKVFHDAVSLLDGYKVEYDLVLMDIMLPVMDGMRAARKLREMDREVSLIFITNYTDYAVDGYEVGACGFVKKPVSYTDFERKLESAVTSIKNRDKRVITISSGSSRYRMKVRDIMYVESYGHICVYHTLHKNIESRNTISALAEELKQFDFISCNRSYLINPIYIKHIGLNSVIVGEDELTISRLKKKEFLTSFNDWLMRGGDVL